MAIVFDENGKYVDEKGLVKLDPTMFADWQIAEEAEKTLPSVDCTFVVHGRNHRLDHFAISKC